MAQESIDFSLHLSTIYCQCLELLADRAKNLHDLTYNEFSTLYALLETRDTISVENLADYLMLEQSSLRHILLPLEDRMFIEKVSDPSDGRFMVVRLNPKRPDEVLSTVKDIHEHLEDIFCLSRYANAIISAIPSTMRASLDVLRGFAIPEVGAETTPGSKFFNSGYPVFWRVMVERWNACTQRCASLTFNEYRMLQALDEQHTMSARDICEKLLLSKGTVSGMRKQLAERKLVQSQPSPFDARTHLITISKKGRLTAQKVLSELNDLTRSVHLIGSDEGVIELQAWHALMYSSLLSHIRAGQVGTEKSIRSN